MKLKTKFGMVVSGHKKASQAGMKILKNGGNAMDAAIATAATLSIAIPNMNGLGGEAFLWPLTTIPNLVFSFIKNHLIRRAFVHNV